MIRLAMSTGIAPTVWLAEEPAALSTALDLLAADLDAARRA